MTLDQYAFRIAGPIDFVVNLAINLLIALYFLWDAPQLPLMGWPSAISFFGPMVFCVLTFATFFGYLNGVTQRGRGLGGGPISDGTHWPRIGLFAGLKYGCLGVVLLLLICLLIDAAQPALLIPGWTIVVIDGIGAGIIGYAAQVNGVLRTKEFEGADG